MEIDESGIDIIERPQKKKDNSNSNNNNNSVQSINSNDDDDVLVSEMPTSVETKEDDQEFQLSNNTYESQNDRDEDALGSNNSIGGDDNHFDLHMDDNNQYYTDYQVKTDHIALFQPNTSYEPSFDDDICTTRPLSSLPILTTSPFEQDQHPQLQQVSPTKMAKASSLLSSPHSKLKTSISTRTFLDDDHPTILDAPIKMNTVRLLVRKNELFKCRFLLSKLSKPIQDNDTFQSNLQLIVHLLLENKDMHFMRENRLLVSKRVHSKNSIASKFSIQDNLGNDIHINRNKYTFIIQIL
ncbi:hypothetical protein CYY_003061 [Polysphondylium violaceum]|uniref:Uncharacterized protein n=1 Tax=Polysphondylium violaceum TaxID=133409 RepID=A0A8J4PX77_9MYCE|nr:hypothetical protein CYY_003061 [Polysphondylium violaceum]